MTTPERSVNPDTCCLDCKRYGTTPSKFPIYCSNNDCKCHKTPTPEKSIEGIEEIKERFRNKILDEQIKKFKSHTE